MGGGDVVYNLWGDAVSLAHRIRTEAGDAGILYVTDDVKERLAGTYAFEQVGTVVVDGSEKAVWRLQPGGTSLWNCLTSQSWFGWSLALIIGLPVLVIALSEVHLRLQRKGSALAKPVNRLRIWLLP